MIVIFFDVIFVFSGISSELVTPINYLLTITALQLCSEYSSLHFSMTKLRNNICLQDFFRFPPQVTLHQPAVKFGIVIIYYPINRYTKVHRLSPSIFDTIDSCFTFLTSVSKRVIIILCRKLPSHHPCFLQSPPHIFEHAFLVLDLFILTIRHYLNSHKV